MDQGQHIDHLLSDYLDAELSEFEQINVETHLATCASCRHKLLELQTLIAELRRLPSEIDAPPQLWQSIKEDLGELQRPVRNKLRDRNPVRQKSRVAPEWTLVTNWKIMLSLLILVGGGLVAVSFRNTYEVSKRSGAPLVGNEVLTESRKLRKGEWITTDDSSAAYLKLGAIGNVEVAPGTRLQVQDKRVWHHELTLNVGRIHARIWAPPRRFFVKTPAGLAIDLGCEYTLEVDSSGYSVLHVLSGFVGFARGTREVIAPAGWLVRARPDRAPGTPYAETASVAFQQALERFDFGSYSRIVLHELLDEARPEDAISLLELLWRTQEQDRARVYDRLTTLVDPPDGVSREKSLVRDPQTMDAWRAHLGVGVTYWLEYKKKNKVKK